VIVQGLKVIAVFEQVQSSFYIKGVLRSREQNGFPGVIEKRE
jgi:hypothetical protein